MTIGILPGYDPPEPPEYGTKCPDCGADAFGDLVQDKGFVVYECIVCQLVFKEYW